MYIKYSKLRENSIAPSRSNPSDAGMDVFWCPELNEEGKLVKRTGGQPTHDMNDNKLAIFPGHSVVLETGLKFEVPHGYMLEVKNRSSVASKKSLIVGACVVDSGYSGEVFINLHNVGGKEQTITEGDKIAQIVMIPVVKPDLIQVEEEELYSNPKTISNRGEGGFGSTGEK